MLISQSVFDSFVLDIKEEGTQFYSSKLKEYIKEIRFASFLERDMVDTVGSLLEIEERTRYF